MATATSNSQKMKVSTLADWYYYQGWKSVEDKDCESALSYWCSAFSTRNDTLLDCEDRLWSVFFETQFSIYLLGKQKFTISFPEGDMVYSLIKDRWLDLRREIASSQLPFYGTCMETWLASVPIDFPWDFEPGE